MEQDSAFISKVIIYLFKKLGIKIRQLLLIINLYKQNMELSP